MESVDIIRLAREAGLKLFNEGWTSSDNGDAVAEENLERFAALVAAHERERILEMCKEGWWDGEGIRYHLEKQDAIRSRT